MFIHSGMFRYTSEFQLLNEHSDHEVHLFEADDRAGGHANTVGCRIGGVDVRVDT